MNKKALTLAALMAFACPLASAQTVRITSGYLTVQSWLHLLYGQRELYVMGVADGVRLAPIYGGSDKDKRLLKINECMSNVNNEQLLAVMDKAANDHPEQWNLSMNAFVAEQLHHLCGL